MANYGKRGVLAAGIVQAAPVALPEAAGGDCLCQTPAVLWRFSHAPVSTHICTHDVSREEALSSRTGAEPGRRAGVARSGNWQFASGFVRPNLLMGLSGRLV